MPLFLFVRDYLRVENRHVMLRLHILTVAVKCWVRGRLKKTALQNVPASEESESDYDSVFGYLEDDLNTIVSTIVEEEMAENDNADEVKPD